MKVSDQARRAAMGTLMPLIFVCIDIVGGLMLWLILVRLPQAAGPLRSQASKCYRCYRCSS